MAAKKSLETEITPDVAKKAPMANSPRVAKKKKTRAERRTDAKKLSALDAAALVLGATGHAMTCKEMIDAMAAGGYWTSPAGQTPQATIYSGIIREINIKGTHARFKKTERGKFALSPTSA